MSIQCEFKKGKKNKKQKQEIQIKRRTKQVDASLVRVQQHKKRGPRALERLPAETRVFLRVVSLVSQMNCKVTDQTLTQIWKCDKYMQHQRWRQHRAIYCLHCLYFDWLNISTYAYTIHIVIRLERCWMQALWAFEQNVEVEGLDDTPYTVMTTRTPRVLTNSASSPRKFGDEISATQIAEDGTATPTPIPVQQNQKLEIRKYLGN